MKFSFFKQLNKTTQSDKWLDKFQIKTFIDIGAYKGEYIDFALQHFPQAFIYAFEPLPEMYDLLKRKTFDNKKIKVYPYALGEKRELRDMFQSSYPPSSSLLPMDNLHKINFPESRRHNKIQIEVRILDSILRTKKLPRNIFIKIDTQGYEDKVITGGQNILQKSSLVLIEVSFQRLYKGQKLFHEIYTKLHNIGFLLSGFRNQIISPLDGSILQAHGFFIHKDYINLL